MEQISNFGEYPPAVQNEIYDLVVKGGEVNPQYLMAGLKRAYSVGCIVANGKIIATASIKVPLQAYVEKIEKESASLNLYNEDLFELGYVYVLPEYRGEKLIYPLLDQLLQCNNPLLSTTKVDNIAMIKILLFYGFVRIGEPYRSDQRDTLLQAFIREKNNLFI